MNIDPKDLDWLESNCPESLRGPELPAFAEKLLAYARAGSLQEFKANLTEDVTSLRKLLLEAKAELEWFQRHWCEEDPSGLRTGIVRVTRLLATIEEKVPVADNDPPTPHTHDPLTGRPLLPRVDGPCDYFTPGALRQFRCGYCGHSMRDHLIKQQAKR